MKKAVIILFVILFTGSADGFSQRKKERYRVKADTVKVDSLEYQLLVSDPGFDTWLEMKPPVEFYSKVYYEQRNRLYVSEWNKRFISSRNKGLYENYIDYIPSTDYGLNMNYKLYYFFRYFEEKNNVKLYPPGR